jgi:predicted enzyme related to lactoylglutathione lyase
MANPVVHFEVMGKDGAGLSKFYGDAFGWEMQSVAPEYTMAHPGAENGIDGGVGSAPEGQPGHVTFYVEVDDLNAALEKVKGLGGSTVAEPMDVPNGPSIALFSDPEGHLVGLVKGM